MADFFVVHCSISLHLLLIFLLCSSSHVLFLQVNVRLVFIIDAVFMSLLSMFHFPFFIYPNLLSPFLQTALALAYIRLLVLGHLPIFMWPDELSVYLIALFLSLAHTVFPL
jgi:hypothetical protein